MPANGRELRRTASFDCWQAKTESHTSEEQDNLAVAAVRAREMKKKGPFPSVRIWFLILRLGLGEQLACRK